MAALFSGGGGGGDRVGLQSPFYSKGGEGSLVPMGGDQTGEQQKLRDRHQAPFGCGEKSNGSTSVGSSASGRAGVSHFYCVGHSRPEPSGPLSSVSNSSFTSPFSSAPGSRGCRVYGGSSSASSQQAESGGVGAGPQMLLSGPSALADDAGDSTNGSSVVAPPSTLEDLLNALRFYGAAADSDGGGAKTEEEEDSALGGGLRQERKGPGRCEQEGVWGWAQKVHDNRKGRRGESQAGGDVRCIGCGLGGRNDADASSMWTRKQVGAATPEVAPSNAFLTSCGKQNHHVGSNSGSGADLQGAGGASGKPKSKEEERTMFPSFTRTGSGGFGGRRGGEAESEKRPTPSVFPGAAQKQLVSGVAATNGSASSPYGPQESGGGLGAGVGGGGARASGVLSVADMLAAQGINSSNIVGDGRGARGVDNPEERNNAVSKMVTGCVGESGGIIPGLGIEENDGRTMRSNTVDDFLCSTDCMELYLGSRRGKGETDQTGSRGSVSDSRDRDTDRGVMTAASAISGSGGGVFESFPGGGGCPWQPRPPGNAFEKIRSAGPKCTSWRWGTPCPGDYCVGSDRRRESDGQRPGAGEGIGRAILESRFLPGFV